MSTRKSAKKIFDLPRRFAVLAAVCLAFMTIAVTVAFAKEQTVIVEAGVLNVRTGPGLSYDVMTQTMKGDRLKVIEEKNEWYKVRLADDKIGWVASWLVKNTEVAAASNYIGVVTGKEVNIRKKASAESQIIGTVTEGTELAVLFQQDHWVQVQYHEQVAWISKDFIALTQKPAVPSVTSEKQTVSNQKVTVRGNGTNIRTGTSIEHTVIQKANQGETFDYLEADGDWYKIALDDGKEGYIAGWTVDLSSSNKMAPVSQVTSLSEATIVIDAGHGGKDPGAVDGNLTEKELTLKTSLLLAQKLKAYGTNVVLTRNGDEFISLNDRVYKAHQINADAFISLHYDAIETPNTMSGTTTYYYRDASLHLAEQVNQGLAAHGPLRNNGVRKGNYYVLRENAQPSILLELGYVNSATDASMIYSDRYNSLVTDSIVQALASYFSGK